MKNMDDYCKLVLKKYLKIKKSKKQSLIKDNKELTKMKDKLIKFKKKRNNNIDGVLNSINNKINKNNNFIEFKNNKTLNKALYNICYKISPFIYDEVSNLDTDYFLRSIELFLNNDEEIYEIENEVSNRNYKINQKDLEQAIEELKLECKVSLQLNNSNKKIVKANTILDNIIDNLQN